jgi:tetratricopeptide (TPR) repeat protein
MSMKPPPGSGPGPRSALNQSHISGPFGWRVDLETTLRWVILLSAVFYRVALYLELRSIGFFNFVFVDNKAIMDISLRFLDGELPGPLMKPSLWFIQLQAILLRLGVGLEGLHMIQYLSGILLVWTLLTLGKRVFGSVPALISGGLMAFYGPLLFQESQLVTASWAALFLTLAVLLPLAFAASPSTPIYLLSGLFMGLGVQSQANMIIAAGAFFLGLWFSLQRGKRVALLAFPLGVLLVLLPLTVHNLRSGELLPLSALGGVNFFIGNGPESDGTFTLPEGYSLVNEASELGPSSLIYPGEVLGGPVNYGEASRFWTMLTLRHMAAHPLSAFALMIKKAALFTHGWEAQNNFSYYFFREQLVKLPLPLDFGILLALALPWLFQRGRSMERGPLLWVLGGYAFSVVLFFVIDRYRLPLVPLVALLAGAGIVEIRSRWHSGGVRQVRGLLLLVVVALFLTHIPGWSSPEAEVAQGWNYIGSEYSREGREDDSAVAFAKVLQTDSNNIQALFSLGSIHANRGEFGRAELLYLRVLEIDGTDQDALVQLGRVLQDGGDLERSLKVFSSGVAAYPDNAGFYEGAAGVLLEMGQAKKSADVLRRAAAMGLRNSELLLLEDRVRQMLQDRSLAPR